MSILIVIAVLLLLVLCACVGLVIEAHMIRKSLQDLVTRMFLLK